MSGKVKGVSIRRKYFGALGKNSTTKGLVRGGIYKTVLLYTLYVLRTFKVLFPTNFSISVPIALKKVAHSMLDVKTGIGT